MLQSEPAIMIVRCNRNCLKDHRLKRSEIWGTITESRRFNAMLRVCMGAMRRVNHVKLVKFSIRQYQRSPQGHGSHHLCTLRAVADKQLTEKTRHLEYENRIKMVKHDFRNLKTRRGLQKRHGRAKRKAQGYLDLWNRVKPATKQSALNAGKP